ncbi:MAG: hypothetical protein N2235_18625 [Fischerella sp.]|nr:hypothetical protein [Fischerella sp.]
MTWGQPLGLDELMIVNPGLPGSGAFFLGEDGTLYQVQGLGEAEELQGGEFFLGEDGTLYQVQGLGESEELQGGEFFLGEDGRLYQVQGFDSVGLFQTSTKHTCRCMRR